MSNIQKIKMLSGIVAVGFLVLVGAAQAATIPTTLALTPTTGDGIQIRAAGKENSPLQLSFLAPGASTVTTIVLGTTDTTGRFSTSVSSGGYGIPSGSAVFASVSGSLSPMMLWPTYTSALTLTKTTAELAIGQSITVGGSTALILAANSQSAGIATSISGSQLTITGRANGSGTVTVCGAAVGCGSVVVDIGGDNSQTAITFSPSNPVMRANKSDSVRVFGGGGDGYWIKSNSNPNVLDPNIGESDNTVWMFSKKAGESTLTICSAQERANCANVVVTVLNDTNAALSFTPNTLTLLPGVTQSATISGGVNGGYYVSSNTNSAVAQATVSGNAVTVVGGGTVGSTVVTVCSTTVSNTCGTMTVAQNGTTTSASATTLVFSQNIVSLPKGETSNVTVTGGNNSGYVISSNTAPNVVSASINGSSNVIALLGNAVGSSLVTVCSASAGTTCASVYVTVNPALSTLVLGQQAVSLTSGEKRIISLHGGDSHTVVFSNTNPAAVSTYIPSDGSGLVLTGGTTPGTSVITLCPTNAVSSKCAAVTATVPERTATPPVSAPAVTPARPTTESVASAIKVRIVGTPTLRVRQSNTTNSPSIGSVQQNEIFTVLQENNRWYKITTASGVTGWISGAYAVKQ